MFVHGDNIQGKITSHRKYRDEKSEEYLAEIKVRYEEWKGANAALTGPCAESDPSDRETVAKRTDLLREYKDFIDAKRFAEHFDSRSNLASSVLEEFLYYLFQDLVEGFGSHALIGKSHAFKDLFFVPPSYVAMLERPHAQVERKDHDFVIGATVTASFRTRPSLDDGGTETPDEEPDVEEPDDDDQTDEVSILEPTEYNEVGLVDGAETLAFDVPAVAIECKTYLDKTMLEGSSRAAEEIKARNPNGLYYVLCERLKLSGAVNLRKYAVDQIYVLRQERNIDQEFRLLEDYDGNDIAEDVVVHLFETVRAALVTDWSSRPRRGDRTRLASVAASVGSVDSDDPDD
ncbi:MAG: Bpu10I family restriction endonuclease [Thermoleophilaceae bacterium]